MHSPHNVPIDSALLRPRPLFHNPKAYLECREPGGVRGRLKGRGEQRALEKCLRAVGPIRTVCDVPCGPGRLFDFWKRHEAKVVAFDLAEEMVAAARSCHEDLALDGEVAKADAFELVAQMPKRVDLVACVRFAYYFDRDSRVELWRALADVSERHILVQFKVSGSLRGKMQSVRRALRPKRRRARRHPRHVLTRQEIEQEVALAGLRLVRFVRAGMFSNSAYALAEKPAGNVVSATAWAA